MPRAHETGGSNPPIQTNAKMAVVENQGNEDDTMAVVPIPMTQFEERRLVAGIKRARALGAVSDGAAVLWMLDVWLEAVAKLER